jgi:glyoxylase-like metal-dependent hydrolase (beta-lactamase superfamily II)
MQPCCSVSRLPPPRASATAPSRRALLVGTACAAAALALPGRPVGAAAKPALKLGAFEITVVSDGELVQPTANLAVSAPVQERAVVLRAAGHNGEMFTTALNVTLIRTPSELILVDAGGGANFQPTVGRLVENLEALGTSPDKITKIIISHGHADHLWGLIDGFDDIQFPNATYIMSALERDFWMGADAFKGIDEARHGFVPAARRILPRIADKLTLVKGGEEIVPGLRVLDTRGHSPGHLAIEVAGAGGLIIVNDAITHPLISFQHPDWVSRGDQDADLGAKTRQRLLDRIATDKLRMIGYHLPYPGIGFVERKDRAYRFVPVA